MGKFIKIVYLINLLSFLNIWNVKNAYIIRKHSLFTSKEMAMYINQKDLFIIKLSIAFAVVESGLDSMIINKKENAVGLLQIRPCMLNYINKKYNKNFTLNDRYSAIKSFEMFKIVMDDRNLDYNVRKATYIWNGLKSPYSYYLKVKRNLNNFQSNEIYEKFIEYYFFNHI